MKKTSCFLVLLLLLLPISGCWNRREPSMLAISDSVLYDIKDDGSYETTLELLNPSQSSGSGSQGEGGGEKKKTLIIKSEGKSAAESIRNATKSIDRKVYIPHTRTRFFTEKLASQGIIELFDFFVRDHETRQNSYVVVVRSDHPELLYECCTGFQDSMGAYIESLTDAQQKSTSFSAYVTTLDFIKAYYEDGRQPVAGVVEIVEDQATTSPGNQTNEQQTAAGGEKSNVSKEYKIEYSGLAAFKNGKLAGFLSREETQAYNIIINEFKNYFFSVSVNGMDNNFVLEALSTKTEIKTAIQDNKAEIKVLVKFELALANNSETLDMENPEDKKMVTESFNRQIENQINSAIKKVQTEFKSDIFGFGKYLHIQHPKDWGKIRGDWDEFFEKAAVSVKVESSLRRTGELQDPIKLETEY